MHDTSTYITDTLLVTIGAFVLIVVLKLIEPRAFHSNPTFARTLVEQSLKWHALSEQDRQPIVAMQHANYAMAYINAARHLESDVNLERLTKRDMYQLVKELEARQRSTTKDLATKQGGTKPKVGKVQTEVSWLV